jgi:chemotaxis signal transduction protein
MSLRGHHTTVSTHKQGISFLVVRLGETRLALPADGVRGVLTSAEAGIGDSISAVGITYRHIDLTGLLLLSADFSTTATRVVLYSNGRTHGALRVEQVFGLTEVESTQCVPLPAHFRADERTWFSGMILHETGLALVVNPAWLLGEVAEVVTMAADGMSSQSGSRMVVGGVSC